MSDFSDELKKILKPLFVALILVVLVFIFASQKDENTSLLSLDLPETIYSQSIFADPTKKPRPEYPEFLFVQESYLRAISPSITVTPQVLGALIEGFEPQDLQKTIVEYMVESGDSLWSIAAKFDISLNTVLWANNLNKNSVIQPGQKLIIPPVSGVIHHVKAGDIVGEIAEKYKAKTQEIISFNGLSSEADIFIGDILVIPNGVVPAPTIRYAPARIPLAESYFICPISSPCRITQGLHWYNAIDFSHSKCGEPIYAAAGGKVLKVKLTRSTSRWAFKGAGNHLTILHPNGVVTVYAHLASSFVNPGDTVSQGQIIALMGGQPGTPGAGRSTGCHLHFGVRGARNPFAK
ncbi:MAG: LysM peptidoglycan-binding domain-containing protein [Candidatus Paceibacterales bacterium]